MSPGTYYPGLCNHYDKPACVDTCPKDLHLLAATSTPAAMPVAGLSRRKALARLLKPAMNKAGSLGLLGLAGAVFVKGVQEGQEEKVRRGRRPGRPDGQHIRPGSTRGSPLLFKVMGSLFLF